MIPRREASSSGEGKEGSGFTREDANAGREEKGKDGLEGFFDPNGICGEFGP